MSELCALERKLLDNFPPNSLRIYQLGQCINAQEGVLIINPIFGQKPPKSRFIF